MTSFQASDPIHPPASNGISESSDRLFFQSKIDLTGISKADSLAALWARKYVHSLTTKSEAETLRRDKSLAEATSEQGRLETYEFLKPRLQSASAQAWSKTETLLAGEVQRHGIAPELINPWEIAAESHALFETCLDSYSQRMTPRRLSVVISKDLGRIRRKYTAHDPRVIGFVSMQFHYTGMMLLDQLSPVERSLLSAYLKVMDDHLYMPLRDAYEAATHYAIDSPILKAVQTLIQVSTKIACKVVQHVCRLYPSYETYSGSLNSPVVKTASIRDVEMFQVYLCLCVLETHMRSVQQELFPLCVMLYPRLGVQWKLVQELIRAVGWEMHDRLPTENVAVFLPYLRALSEMFSLEVLYDL